MRRKEVDFQMRSKLRTICAALLAVFALTAVAASSASAAPEWYVKKGGVFEKVKEAINVEGTASWEVTDKVSIFERFGVKCTSKDFGQIKPGGKSTLEEEREFNCTPVKGCEHLGANLGVVGLNWNLELYTEGTEIRSRITSEHKETTPAIAFTCRQNLTEKTDECGVNTSTKMMNIPLSGFVEATFDAKSAKTNCSWGGTGKGEWTGTLVTVKPKAGTGVEAIKAQ
jgi:hypothetical protein